MDVHVPIDRDDSRPRSVVLLATGNHPEVALTPADAALFQVTRVAFLGLTLDDQLQLTEMSPLSKPTTVQRFV